MGVYDAEFLRPGYVGTQKFMCCAKTYFESVTPVQCPPYFDYSNCLRIF